MSILQPTVTGKCDASTQTALSLSQPPKQEEQVVSEVTDKVESVAKSLEQQPQEVSLNPALRHRIITTIQDLRDSIDSKCALAMVVLFVAGLAAVALLCTGTAFILSATVVSAATAGGVCAGLGTSIPLALYCKHKVHIACMDSRILGSSEFQVHVRQKLSEKNIEYLDPMSDAELAREIREIFHQYIPVNG